MARINSSLQRGAIVVLALCWVGCTINPNPNATPKDPVEKLYNIAVEDMEDGLFPEAIKGFTEIRTKHPYTPWARLALLRIADSNLERGKFSEAVDGYRNFLKYYPKHDQAPYARLQIGNAYFDQIPGEWWFLPPTAEKDQANIRRAIDAYREMTSSHPDSEESKIAQKHIKECRQKLAEHELYVAQFYFEREKFKGTVRRANYLLAHYPNLGLDTQALLLGAKAHIAQDEPAKAREKLSRLVEEFSGTEEATAAQKLLKTLPVTLAPKS